jgi:hypothetical protein
MAHINTAQLAAAERIQGPYHLFSGSFVLEFLEPPREIAATYVPPLSPLSSLDAFPLLTFYPTNPFLPITLS